MQNFVGKTKCIAGYMKVANVRLFRIYPTHDVIIPASGFSDFVSNCFSLGKQFLVPKNVETNTK